MREQLIQYVQLLFAGAQDCEDTKQEILQNTLDRYDDLIADGKSPEAAYRLAIMGIGDINEILGAAPCATLSAPAVETKPEKQDTAPQNELSKSVSGLIWAVGIALYFLISFITCAWHITWVIFLIIPAVQSLVRLLLERRDADKVPYSGSRQLKKSLDGIIWLLGLALYFIVSFATGGWYITWVLFLITAAVQGLARAILDLKEAVEYEN